MHLAETKRAIAAIEPDIEATRAARLVDVRGDNRYVVPGLIDLHTHVAYGATTPGVGMACVDPDVGPEIVIDDVVHANGVALAPDERTIYLSDTRARRIIVFDVDHNTYSAAVWVE